MVGKTAEQEHSEHSCNRTDRHDRSDLRFRKTASRAVVQWDIIVVYHKRRIVEKVKEEKLQSLFFHVVFPSLFFL